MSVRRVDRAIILAAGRGSRLSQGDASLKPLRCVAGTPLIVRVLKTLRSEGIHEAVIVLGFEGQQLRRALEVSTELSGLRLIFVDNPRWESSNGLSVLAAEALIDRDCLLLMADHLIAPELVRRLVRSELPEGACALGVDFDIERCFDIEDATKVRVAAERIVAIGKTLEGYNAIDTGVFRVGRALVEALSAVNDLRGDASLSDGVRALAERGKMVALDIGDAQWIDVDTPDAHACAEAMVRVFGDTLDEDGHDTTTTIDPEALELLAPSWVRGAAPYREDHFALADREARRSPDTLARLMSNENPFGLSPGVIAAVTDVLARGHLYPDAALSRELRERLGAPYELPEESCVLGSGSSEVIDLLVRTFVAPGEEVLIAVPTFSMYESRTRVAGGVPVLVPMRDELVPDLPALLGAVTERTKLIFLCSPNNPTGRRLDEATLRRVLRLAIPVAIDEAYVEFGDGPSVAGLIHAHPNLMVVRTFSKAYGLAGLRIGYALAAPPVARLLSRVKLPWNVSTLALAAALAVLDETDVFESHRRHLVEERRWLQRSLSGLPGVTVFEGEGNFVLLDIHECGLSADTLVQALLREGIFIRALASHHLKRGWVRVSVGRTDDNRRCVEAFKRVLRQGSRPGAPGGMGGM